MSPCLVVSFKIYQDMRQFHRMFVDVKIVCSLKWATRQFKQSCKVFLLEESLTSECSPPETPGNPQERAIMNVLIVRKTLIRHHT